MFIKNLRISHVSSSLWACSSDNPTSPAVCTSSRDLHVICRWWRSISLLNSWFQKWMRLELTWWSIGGYPKLGGKPSKNCGKFYLSRVAVMQIGTMSLKWCYRFLEVSPGKLHIIHIWSFHRSGFNTYRLVHCSHPAMKNVLFETTQV